MRKLSRRDFVFLSSGAAFGNLAVSGAAFADDEAGGNGGGFSHSGCLHEEAVCQRVQRRTDMRRLRMSEIEPAELTLIHSSTRLSRPSLEPANEGAGG